MFIIGVKPIIMIDLELIEKIRMLAAIEMAFIVSLFMALKPVYQHIRELETKLNDIQFTLGGMIADIKINENICNYKELSNELKNLTDRVMAMTEHLEKKNGFKFRKQNQIKYLDYDP
jgi:hypothetical protein